MCRDVYDAYGIAFPEELKEVVGTESGRCLIVGSGWNIFEDLLNAGFQKNEYLQRGFDVMGINRAVQDLPCYVKHGYSNHARNLRIWYQGRDETHQKKDKHKPKTTLHSNRDGVDVCWRWPGWGTSSLGAVLTAISLGYDEIVICGVPMDNGGHYYDPPWYETNFGNDNNERSWRQASERVFKGKVSVMSGRLKEII